MIAFGVGLTTTVMLLLGAIAVGYLHATDPEARAEARCRQVPEAEWSRCRKEEADRSARDVAAPLLWGASGTAALTVLGASLDRRKSVMASAAGTVAVVAAAWIALGLG